MGIDTPKTYWSGTDLSDLESVDLPEDWVLKPNHRSGLVYFGHGEADIGKLAHVTHGWLDEVQGAKKGEWAYTLARPLLLVEERLSPGASATDYKVYVFDGEPYLITEDTDRITGGHRRLFTQDWTPRPETLAFPIGPITDPPPELPLILSGARAMAGDFDFVRVDFYIDRGRVLLGEVTAYASGGLDPWEPHAIDMELGDVWNLPSNQ